MVKVALIGAGKMGISHLAILGAHPEVEVVGVSDTSKMVLSVIGKYTSFPCYDDIDKMIEKERPDAVFVAVPTKFHAKIVYKLLQKKIHVFAEKPFCLNPAEGKDLIELAEKNNLVNQVGYHNRFIGTFQEVKRIVDKKYIGDLFHFVGESYGPVVVRSKQDSWRSDPKEGGGCLMDYASHVIDLINYILGPIMEVNGSMLKSFYSKNVEDSVYSLLKIDSKLSGLLSVNWSDETYRKMYTSLTIFGSQGKIICDANELKIYFKTNNCPIGYTKGWNVKNITDLTESVDFNLRGEEYSAQVDYFIKTINGQVLNTMNSFKSAWQTDNVIAKIRAN